MTARRADRPNKSGPLVFHVKHKPRSIATSSTASPRHAPQCRSEDTTHSRRTRTRRLATVLIGLVALLAVGCASISSPDGWAGPVGDEDLLIIHEDDGVLAAVQLQNGSAPMLLWRFPADSDDLEFSGIYAQPILDRDRLYIVGFEGIAVALDISGNRPVQIWPAPIELDANVVATPVLSGSQLYVATDRGDVVTIDVNDGTITDVLPLDGSRIWSGGVIDGGVLYVAGLDRRLLTAVSLGPNVSVRWERETPGAVRGDLTLLDELLLVGTFDGTLHAYDIDADGVERWSFEGDGGWFFAPTLPAGDRVYAVTMRGGVYSLNRQGSPIWAQQLEDSEFRVRPIIAGRVLIVADRNGVLTGLDLTDGRTVWSQKLDGAQFDAQPLIVGSKVIYVTTKGEIVSVDPATGAFSRFELGG